MMADALRPWWYWVPVGAYAGLIFYFSSQSVAPGPTIWILELVGDKGVHAVEFGLLGLLCYRAFRYAAGARAARSALWLAILASTGYGVTDEIHQAFVPLREPSGWDVLADGAGASVVSSLWRRFIEP
ncbi:MAG: VanZ family protein [Nitrospirota bacterium]|nr:VanZ family protein [Nitrospirota bacterium]